MKLKKQIISYGHGLSLNKTRVTKKCLLKYSKLGMEGQFGYSMVEMNFYDNVLTNTYQQQL